MYHKFFTYLFLLLFFSCATREGFVKQPLTIETGKKININGENSQEITFKSKGNNKVISGYIQRSGSFVSFLGKDSSQWHDILMLPDKVMTVSPLPTSDIPQLAVVWKSR